MKLTTNIINKLERDFEEKIKREQEEDSRENSPSDHPSTSSSTDPPRRPAPPPYIKRCNDNFTAEGSKAIFNFILGRIRSKNPDRFGRVAKRRVELMRNDFWEKCRIAMGCDREAGSYRNHFNNFARQLHIYDGISLLDKVDLYYALDIKPDPSIRQRLIQNFEVHFDDSGLIAGSYLLHHWDLVHPDSEPEDDEDGFSREYDGNRYTEHDDGLMWQFIVDDINGDNVQESYTPRVWKEFKKKNKKYARIGRCTDSYRLRFYRILLPNLHKMPFDLVTKAVLFYKLGCAVPMEFRSAILEETSATLDEEGFIADFPDCPDHIVLQSHPYNTVIGISSTSRLSSLKAPTSWADTLPYTPEEDKQIWQYIVWRCRVNGKCQRIKEKMSGWAFWKQFQTDCPTKRSWRSLSEHFMEDLRGTIMDLHYDLKTKMELYFALSVPVEEEALAEFKTIAVVVLAKGYMIKYAVGKKFLIGRKDNFKSDEKELEEHNEGEKYRLSFLEMVEFEKGKEKEEAMKALEHLPNKERFPYLNFPQRSMEASRKRKEFMAVMADESKKAKPNTPKHIVHLMPKVEEEPIEELKPTDFLLAPEDVKLEPFLQDFDFPVKNEENITEFIVPEPEIPATPLHRIVPYTSELARNPVPYCPRKPVRPVVPPPARFNSPPPKHRGPPPPYVPQIDTRLRAFLNTDGKVRRPAGGAIPRRRGTPPPYIGCPVLYKKGAVGPVITDPAVVGPPGPGIPFYGPSGVKRAAVGSVEPEVIVPVLTVIKGSGKPATAGPGIPYCGPSGVKKAAMKACQRPSQVKKAGPGTPVLIAPAPVAKKAASGPSGAKKVAVGPGQGPLGSTIPNNVPGPSGVKQLIIKPSIIPKKWPSVLKVVEGNQTIILNRVEQQSSMVAGPEEAPPVVNGAADMPKIEDPEPEVKTEALDDTMGAMTPPEAPVIPKIEAEEPNPEQFIKMEEPEDLEQLTAAVLATMVPVEETKPYVGGGLFEGDGTGGSLQDDGTEGLFEDDFEQDPIDYQAPSTSRHVPYTGRQRLTVTGESFDDDFEQEPIDYQAPSTSGSVPYTSRQTPYHLGSSRIALPPRPTCPVPYQGWKKGTRVPKILKKKPPTKEQHERDQELRIAGRAPNLQIKPALLLAASLPEIRNNKKEEQHERNQELKNAKRAPNLQITPALLLAASLPEIRNREGRSPPKYFGSQKPEDQIGKAFSDVADHLKTFTKEMEAIRPLLKKKERESCMYKVMEISKELRNDAKMSLIKGIPKYPESHK